MRVIYCKSFETYYNLTLIPCKFSIDQCWNKKQVADRLEALDPQLEEEVRQAVVFLDESADTIPYVFQVPFCFESKSYIEK